MANWAIQCKSIPTMEILRSIRILQLCDIEGYWMENLNKELTWKLLSKMLDIQAPIKVVKRKTQKLERKGFVGDCLGDYGLTEKGMAQFEEVGIYRWHSLTSIPQLYASILNRPHVT